MFIQFDHEKLDVFYFSEFSVALLPKRPSSVSVTEITEMLACNKVKHVFAFDL